MRILIYGLIYSILSLKAEENSITSQKTECDKHTSLEWSNNLNRCVTKKEVLSERNEAEQCNQLANETEQKACHLKLAEKKTSLNSNPDDLPQGNTTGSLVMNGAYSIVAAINMTGQGGFKSTCLSKNIFHTTALAGISSDLFLKYKASSKIKELKNKFSKDIKEGKTDNQYKALEYLKEEQVTVGEIASLEKKRNILLGLGYGASAIAAGYELAFPENNVECMKGDSKTTDSKTNNDKIKNENTSSSPKVNSFMNVVNSITKYTNDSKGILAMSSLGTIYSAILYNGAAKQEEDSKENITKIEKIMKVYQDSILHTCPSGRESLEDPKCYCYLEDGKQNKNRTNSQTCQSLWKKDTYKITVTPSDYSNPSGFVDPKGCLNSKGQFDENCKCKKFLDNKNNNSCMKITGMSVPLSLGQGFIKDLGVDKLANFANNSFSGDPKLSNLNSNLLNQQAISSKAKFNSLADQITKKISPNANDILKLDPKNAASLAKNIFGEQALKSFSKNSNSAQGGILESRNEIPQLKSEIEKISKNAGLIESDSKNEKLLPKKSEVAFNFLNEGGSANNSNGQNMEFSNENKNYNFKNNDISKLDDRSLFDIISKRYLNSGLKRLFDN